ncbi:hypothetical protein [Rhizobium sp. 1399]|uniref:hypothetical protein n=1 Tax=Rhizobium sp. 1399 TaxID=2817758 RepID=UPI0028609D92|nr:hypothetical protein [Rhizobium sp. 1399]MDR6664032.1 hypothetical protein [Rhizobium sp. 1399]
MQITENSKPARLRALTISEICTVVSDHRDLLQLIDGKPPADPTAREEYDKNILLGLLKRCPEGLAALGACALDHPHDAAVQAGILKTNSDFQLNLAAKVIDMTATDFEGPFSLFMQVLTRLSELGLSELTTQISRLSGFSSSPIPANEADQQSKPLIENPKKRSGRKAA